MSQYQKGTFDNYCTGSLITKTSYDLVCKKGCFKISWVLLQYDYVGYENQELPCVNAPIAYLVVNDTVYCECTRSDESFVANSVHCLNGKWLDNETGDASESLDNSSESIDSIDTVEQLRRWAAAASIKQSAVSELLTMLRSRIPELPAVNLRVFMLMK